MKTYTFTLAPFIAIDFAARGYDNDKLTQAIESEGNANLKLDTSASGVSQRHSFTPASVNSRGGKPASSRAKIGHTFVFDGTGSICEEFAGWHDAVVAMAKRYGTLTAIPLTVRLQTWLDAKFKAAVDADKAKGNGRNGRNGDVKPNVPAVQVPA